MHGYVKYRSSLFSRLLPFGIVVSLGFSLFLFLFWLISVVLPILSIEASYQVQYALNQYLGYSDIRGLILPAFRVEIGQTTAYPQGSIVIPSLFLDEPVLYNIDPNNEVLYTEALKKGIAHASGTSLPDNGGLGYYFAHSSTPALKTQYNAVFYLLGKLQGGEIVSLWNQGNRFDYRVVKKQITVPDDVSFLTNSYSTEQIVLQTCWPPGTSEKRLLVFAERIE